MTGLGATSTPERMTADGPMLMDCATIARELGVSRAAAEAFMRKVPKVQPEGLRKTYVKRADLLRYIESVTRV